jgi:predicted dehydrogenase
MLREDHLDGVLNVTPDFLHADVAESVLESGLPLMTEKPLAGDLKGCRALMNAAGRTRTPCVVNFSKRHTSAVEAARILVADGVLGSLIKVEASYLQGWVHTMDWGDWRKVHAWTWRLNRGFAPLGVLADLGSHVVDLLYHITGREVLNVSEAVIDTVDKGIDEVGGLRLDSPDSASASIMLSGNLPVDFQVSRIRSGHRDDLILNLYGEEGRVSINLTRDRKSLSLIPYTPMEPPDDCLDPETQQPIGPLRAEREVHITTYRPKNNYRYFADILNDQPAEAPGISEGFKNLTVLDAIFRSSAANGATVQPEGLTG